MIRKIQQADVEEVVSIYNYYILNTIVSFEEEIITIEEMNKRIKKINSNGFPWIVAEEKGKVIGYAYACQWNIRAAYKKTAEVTVYLSHKNISNGWGTKLYEALFEELKKTSIRIVIGGIALPNPESIGLHEKLNMSEVAHFKKIGYKFNKWIDVVYYQRELNA